jgi:nucleotide-binding universal stress UspA family protein
MSPHAAAAGPLLICHDGSHEAAEALAYAAALLPGARALVVTVWEPVMEEAVSAATAPPVSDPADVNVRKERVANDLAADGARRASESGLAAEPLVVKADGAGATWEAIAKVAEERDARLIVCGARRAGLKSAVLDHVPTALIHHASRPVLVVPSAKAAEERRRDVQERRRGRPFRAFDQTSAAGRRSARAT